MMTPERKDKTRQRLIEIEAWVSATPSPVNYFTRAGFVELLRIAQELLAALDEAEAERLRESMLHTVTKHKLSEKEIEDLWT